MTYRQLLTASSAQLLAANSAHRRETAATPEPARLTTLFPTGARWMHDRLRELQPAPTHPFNPGINYTAYGLLKYAICGAGFTLPLIAFPYSPISIPAAIAVFYLLEIHFLFLFPLLVDNTPNPLRTSISAAYKIGVIHCFITVIPIAAYMTIGLFRKSNPLRNWYTGCGAIVIWYYHDLRTRL